ncbi:MAG TPA: hypothetical protein VM390_11680, partial [Acidimicrobiales bacterium]|nr:hypothetical protein [Acidimicrobiales bacterium]
HRRSAGRRPAPAGLAVFFLAGAVLAALVAVVVTWAGGRGAGTGEGGSPETSAARAPGEAAGTVPAGWVSYQHPTVGFTLRHPPGWTIETSGTLTDFRDPATGAYLRVDYTTSPGPSAEQAWLDLEPRFAAAHAGYRRIRIEPTTYQGYPAAIWEFTYTDGGAPLRAVDLGFVTGPYGFALNFQTPARLWDPMQDQFEAFKASFRPPAG